MSEHSFPGSVWSPAYSSAYEIGAFVVVLVSQEGPLVSSIRKTARARFPNVKSGEFLPILNPAHECATYEEANRIPEAEEAFPQHA
jgi:hypothetical protein